ncbi:MULTISPECIES: sugar O-acetyltransferase [Paenibacillus]|uniref:Acetyltransferase n=1 Tax=Paenibacillus borealis TaxID=160799 RepID=A0ABX3H0Y3_PAEBO|nr:MULTISPECIES: sugar O-acetyltransferase [Paenibacillus]AIQ18487.1 acetyltransferase [Paenibacillus sp. FSL H7-0357]OMD39886.1 acetyltransferase [Paenibacillus borealis]
MDIEKIKQIINSGEMYDDAGDDVAAVRSLALTMCREYNQKVNTNEGYDMSILKELFSDVGENVYIESNFRCEFGFNISMGHDVYINHDMIILDCNEVKIGNDVFIGPRVGLYAANHAEDPFERADKGVYSKPITIGDRVWLGGDVKVTQGVTIGENSIVGAGSVVTKDIPPNVIAAGNPCKVIRPIKFSDRPWRR